MKKNESIEMGKLGRKINNALQRIIELWDDQGYCRSCGWHSSLYEHSIDSEHVAEFIKNGEFWLPCLNPEDFGCRGITIMDVIK